MLLEFLTSCPRTYIHTQNIDNTHRCFCHIILLNILWNCCSNTYHWGLQLFYDLQNYTELYEINWTLLLSYCAVVFVGSYGVLTLHFTWPLGERFEICLLLTILILFYNSYETRQTIQIESAILKHSWNVERLIEHIRQNVSWGMSWGWWLERNVNC